MAVAGRRSWWRRRGRGPARVARDIERAGGRALAVTTDLADGPQVERLARAAIDHFGRIDTWVNDAGVALGQTVEDSDIAEIEHQCSASACWA